MTQSPRNQFGFTLIEVLVVMLIIGLASGIIVMKVGNFYLSHKNAEIFAKELFARLQLAQKQAIFSNEVIGVAIGESNYSFCTMAYSNEIRWNPLGGRDPFWAPRPIPNNLILTYESNTQHKTPWFSDTRSPHIIIYSSGEVTPFVIRIHSEGKSTMYTIIGDGSGSLAYKESD